VEQEKAQSSDDQTDDPETPFQRVCESFTPKQLDKAYGIRELSRGGKKIGSKVVFFDRPTKIRSISVTMSTRFVKACSNFSLKKPW